MGIVVLCGLVAAVACSAVRTQPDIPKTQQVDGTWQITKIQGQKAQQYLDQPRPELVFTETQQDDNGVYGRLGGSDGCNRLLGEFRFMPKSGLQFSYLGSTRMLCPQGDAQATAIANALNDTMSWRMARKKLELMRDDGSVVLELIR